jgi:hypothetical protein
MPNLGSDRTAEGEFRPVLGVRFSAEVRQKYPKKQPEMGVG